MFLPIGSNISPLRIPWISMAWIGICVLTFAFITWPEIKAPYRETLTFSFAVVPGGENEFWKFFAYQFFHSSWGHLISNLWYLAVFGWMVESLLGPYVFLMAALFSGALAVVPERIFQIDPMLPVVGASGAVAFTIGALAALRPKSEIKFWLMILPIGGFPNTIMVPVRYLIYFWLLLQVSGMAMNQWLHPEPIAYATHISGFILGLGAGIAFRLFSTTYVDTPSALPEKA